MESKLKLRKDVELKLPSIRENVVKSQKMRKSEQRNNKTGYFTNGRKVVKSRNAVDELKAKTAKYVSAGK